MRIKLKNVIQQISEKLSIPKSKISFEAYFKAIDIDVGKGSDEGYRKYLIRSEYKYGPFANCYGGLFITIYVEGLDILGFEIQDIKPYTEINNIEIDKLMAATTECSCFGPGFYSYCPYLILNEIYCKKEDIKTFQDIVSLDPNNTKLQILLKNFDRRGEREKLLKKYNFSLLNKDFFKNLEKKSELEF